MKKPWLKSVVVTVLAVLLGASLTGCKTELSTVFCNHDWARSTCLAPRTCKRCGLTEGKIRSHEWGNTDCSVQEGCIVCGTTEGMELTHQWMEDQRVCKNCGLDERPADDRFMDSLEAGMEARWQLKDVFEAEKNAVLTKEQWAQYFDAEYNCIAAFRDETFQDEILGAAAKRYVASIEASIASLEQFGTEEWEEIYYSGAYNEQMAALFQIHSVRPVEVAEERLEDLEYMLIIGEVIDMAYPLIDQVMFLNVRNDDNLHTYETTIRNTTSLTYEWFQLEVDLLDENGEVLDTEIARVSWWDPNERLRFTFVTRFDFSAMDVRVAQWELENRFWEKG